MFVQLMESERKVKSVYTDGACLGNPGPGGWAVVVNFTDGSVYEMGGSEGETTNNRMELQGAIAGLRLVVASGQTEAVTVFTDSDYVRKGITQWIRGWKNKGWKTSQGKPVQNQDLWESLDQLNSKMVTWQYVPAHTGDRDNERCDAIAKAFASGRSPDLKQALETQKGSSVSPLNGQNALQSTDVALNSGMTDVSASSNPLSSDNAENLPRDVRVGQLRNLIETLRIADEIASHAYLITSSELADLMDVNASAVTSRGDHWVWRNWVVSRVRREGNQILWQLERVD
ncbi:ribonuclease HI [Roseofilum capinflatum]|uniref:Ribonuclease H n=1 Tax=Roseofilum capinflatum BLCC-M114 TaxID=3022440 RepID=A0ABT7BCR2_9CYAN|nr:ribonuclease HI [Roseofilum capinflatum]MDJ1176966.1 ribonuclease HI [Roseofilum capinflatum BLCC-M114]